MGKGNFELYKGDCRELLSKVDVSNVKLLLTDPPYGIGYNAVKNNLPTFNDYGDIQGDEGMDLSFLFELKMEQIVFGANCFPQYLHIEVDGYAGISGQMKVQTKHLEALLNLLGQVEKVDMTKCIE